MSTKALPVLDTLFGKADLEADALGESSERCSYAPPVGEVSAQRPRVVEALEALEALEAPEPLPREIPKA
jgi:hypothetical protein